MYDDGLHGYLSMDEPLWWPESLSIIFTKSNFQFTEIKTWNYPADFSEIQ